VLPEESKANAETYRGSNSPPAAVTATMPTTTPAMPATAVPVATTSMPATATTAMSATVVVSE
jgi:hypothetical protein